MYKAPVEEIAFTLKHVAGMGQAMEEGRLGDLSGDVVDAIRPRPAVLPGMRWSRWPRSAIGRARSLSMAR